MDQLLWNRIGELFAGARQLSGEKRSAFLKEKCGDNQLLYQRLIALLQLDEKSVVAETVSTAFCLPAPRVVADRFRIVRYIAEGGMGTVYEAEDLTLGDRVALKTIRADIAANPRFVELFKREISLGKKVTHPNVCRIYDLGVGRLEDGTEFLFLTMQFLTGETLASRIQRGAIPASEALPLIQDMSGALSAAHQAEVIHRDFKSGNVMLIKGATRPVAVVTDFGLARQVHDNLSLAQTGMVGTVSYMAPEQIRGEEITPATDIYALGVVMYEMLTGELPFKGTSNVTVALKHLNDQPASPCSLRTTLDPHWDETILRCLQKAPSQRFESAEQVKAALPSQGSMSGVRQLRIPWGQTLAASLSLLTACIIVIAIFLLLIPAVRERIRGMLYSSSEKHIAVLPLESSGDPETQALGDGLMDSLAGRLANLDPGNTNLWVVPASEVRSRKVKDPASALREFGATIIVKGSFQRQGRAASLKITLIDSRRTREIGFVDVVSPTGDLGQLQDEAVTRLSRLMNVAGVDSNEHLGQQPTTPAVYEDYLSGLGYFQRHDKPGNIDLAIAALQRAVTTDPQFALGYARLAQVYTMKYRLNSDPELLKKAEANGRRAAELDSRVASTYVALGQIHQLKGEQDLAIAEFQRAVSLDPRDPDAAAGIATAYSTAGRNAEAEAAYLRAAALRPDDWKGYNDLGIFYDAIGRPRDAIAQFTRAIALTPDNSWPYVNLALAYMDLDDPKMLGEAENAFKRSIAISPTFGAFANLGFLYTQEHRFHESVDASLEALKLNKEKDDIWENLADAYEWLGEYGKAEDARNKATQLLERNLKVSPKSAEGQGKLAALYAKEGLRDKALEHLNISLALSPDNEYVLAQAADTYELLGNRKEAVRSLERAISHGLSRGQLNEDPTIQAVLKDPSFTIPATTVSNH